MMPRIYSRILNCERVRNHKDIIYGKDSKEVFCNIVEEVMKGGETL